jgi:CBS domain-containing protein
VHFQPGTDDFVRYYNWAQAISGVVLAPAVNSPLLFGHRLWHETRLALFKHATDTRSETHQARSQQTRVNFGNDWVRHSMLEVFHEDVARFRIILTQDVEEDSMDVLRAGGVPKLSAWRMHNGTIWRWNRACYGIVDGKPGLRIEVRYLPAGPTVADQMANAAFFLGLMSSLPNKYGDVTDMMSFADAKNNFFSAARFGLRSQMVWFGGETYRTKRLILEELLPLAHEGLINAGIDQADINRYLGILQKRVESEMTGAQWMLDSMDAMDPVAKKVVKIRTLTSAILENQRGDKQVADWEMPVIPQNSEWLDNYQTVEQFMSKDLFTVRPEDVIDLAASLMSWKHVRHVPVEDDTGILVGLISYRDLLELIPRIQKESEIIVRDVMKKDLLTVKPDTPTLDALYIMRSKGVGCLPVTMDSKLVGLITAHDFLTVSTRLLEERLKDKPL